MHEITSNICSQTSKVKWIFFLGKKIEWIFYCSREWKRRMENVFKVQYITYFVTLMLYAMAFTLNEFIIYFLISLSILLSLVMNSNSSVSKDTLHSSHIMFTILQHNKHNHTLTGTTFSSFIVLCCFLRHKLSKKKKKVNCCRQKTTENLF